MELNSDAPQVQLTFWFQDVDFFKFQPCFKADVFYWWSLGEILHSPTILKGNGDVSGWWSSLLPWKRLPHSELLLPWRDCLFVVFTTERPWFPSDLFFLEGLGSKRFLSWRMLGRNNSWWFVGREVLHSLRDHPNIKWFIVMVCFKGHTVNTLMVIMPLVSRGICVSSAINTLGSKNGWFLQACVSHLVAEMYQ